MELGKTFSQNIKEALEKSGVAFWQWHNPDVRFGYPAYAIIKLAVSEVGFCKPYYYHPKEGWQPWNDHKKIEIENFNGGRVSKIYDTEEAAITDIDKVTKCNEQYYGGRFEWWDK